MNKFIFFVACILFTYSGASAQSSRLRFGVLVYPNFSNSLQPVSEHISRDYESGIITVSGGVFSEYPLKSNLKLQGGINISGPGYQIPERDLFGDDPNVPLLPTKIKSRFITRSLEIPFNMIWSPGSGSRLFVTAGLSTYLPFAETSILETQYKDGSNSVVRRTYYDFALGYGLQLGMGTTVKLSDAIDFDIVPELKIMHVDYEQKYLSRFLQAGIKLAVRV